MLMIIFRTVESVHAVSDYLARTEEEDFVSRWSLCQRERREENEYISTHIHKWRLSGIETVVSECKALAKCYTSWNVELT